MAILEPAIAASENPFESAAMLVALGEAQLALGEMRRRPTPMPGGRLELSQHESIQYLAARLLMAAGGAEVADEVALELENKLQSQTTALSALIRGENALLDKGQLGTAMREFRFAREDFDFWFGHFLRGRAYFEAEHFPEAIDEFDLLRPRTGARSPTSSSPTAPPCATSRRPSTGSAAATRPSATRTPPAPCTRSTSASAAMPIRRMSWPPTPPTASLPDSPKKRWPARIWGPAGTFLFFSTPVPGAHTPGYENCRPSGARHIDL